MTAFAPHTAIFLHGCDRLQAPDRPLFDIEKIDHGFRLPTTEAQIRAAKCAETVNFVNFRTFGQVR